MKDSLLNQLRWYKRYFLPFKYFLQFALISASYKTPWRPLMKMKAPSLGSELSSASSTSSSSSSFRSSSSTSSSPWSSSPSTSLARRSLRTTWTRTKSLALTLLLGQGKARSPQVLLNSFFTWTPQMQDHDDTLLQASWTLCAWWDFRAKVENIIFVNDRIKKYLWSLVVKAYIQYEVSFCRFQMWRLVTSAPFENLILFLIIMNTVSLMMKFHQVSTNHTFLRWW